MSDNHHVLVQRIFIVIGLNAAIIGIELSNVKKPPNWVALL
jgi:hypothetical protein